MRKRFVYGVQALGLYIFFYLFRLVPVALASSIGGWIGRTLGPHLKASDRARHNLRLIFPEKSGDEIERIVVGMWNNLGRLATEFPHLSRLRMDKALPDWITVEGLEHLQALRESGKTAIMLSAHYGNWEIFAPVARHFGLSLVFVYRAANNPWVEKLYQSGRDSFTEFTAKGSKGTRQLIEALRGGKSLAVLIDQKMNEGISVPFLGRLAKTAPTPAYLALRTQGIIMPVRSERMDGHHLKITFFPPIPLPEGLDRKEAAAIVTERINDAIGEWVYAHPEQWFWLHRRWPESK